MAAVPAPVPPLANAPGPGLVPGPPIPAHAAIPPPPPIPPPPLPADEDVNIPEPPLPWEMQPLGGIVDALRYGLTVPNPPVDFYDFDTLDSIADRLWGPVERTADLVPFGTALVAIGGNVNLDKHVVRTYGDLVDLISRFLKRKQAISTKTKSELRDLVQESGFYGEPEANEDNDRVSNSIELGIRLWLMVSIGKAGLPPSPGTYEQPYIFWERNDTIGDIVYEGFPKKITPKFIEKERLQFTISEATVRENKFPRHFNLRDMARLSGFKIEFTNDLFNHLYVEENNEKKYRTKVYIFHNATMLEELCKNEDLDDGTTRIEAPSEDSGADTGSAASSYLTRSDISAEESIKDPDIISKVARETLDTLGLLIPADNPECQEWFLRRVQGYDTFLDGIFFWMMQRGTWGLIVFIIFHPKGFFNPKAPIRPRNPLLRIDRMAGSQFTPTRSRFHYKYWGLRLMKLEEQFNIPEKATFWSRLYDYRNPRERMGYWAAFWAAVFAILALILTFISMVLAGYAYKEAKVANVFAFAASTSADHAASLSNSISVANNGSTTPPVTIVACCSGSTARNGSMEFSAQISDLSTTVHETSIVILTEIATAMTTVTVLTTESVAPAGRVRL